ncbi:hypothetical protein CHRYSEO8AT_550099 [Chryseobacterium sp. 8AT]|nr:hypothetical protein CHRYSEO8AT_550099 [Chryseobacterium sp. 8AT]
MFFDGLNYQLAIKTHQPFIKDIQPLHIDLINEARNFMFRASFLI